MSKIFVRLGALGIVASIVLFTAALPTEVEARQVNKPAPTAAITIDNFKFGTASLEIAVGTTVTWTNRDDVPHTVTSTTKLFKSPPMDTDEKFSYTFKQAGTFEYFCSLHPHMTGKIVVR